MTKQEQSFLMAKRLKDLRTKKGLSCKELKDALFNEYGINISRDSLMSYEIQTEHHSKIKDGKYPNLNMGVEYLNAFAQFYAVSTDFLLGLSDVPTNDPQAAAAAGYTGLTVEAIKTLAFHKKFGGYFLEILSGLLTPDIFPRCPMSGIINAVKKYDMAMSDTETRLKERIDKDLERLKDGLGIDEVLEDFEIDKRRADVELLSCVIDINKFAESCASGKISEIDRMISDLQEWRKSRKPNGIATWEVKDG